jgi:hypothetical protein
MDRWPIGQRKEHSRLGRLCCLALLFLASTLLGLAEERTLVLPRSVQHLPRVKSVHGRALRGEASAQALLGDFCYSVADYTNAVRWYQLAAAQDNVGAKLSMACCYKLGHGVQKNLTTADKWYRQALLQWSPPGHPNLPKATPARQPKPVSPIRTPASTLQAKARAPAPPSDSDPMKVQVSPPPSTAGQKRSRLPRPGACSKRITTLQQPTPLLLDVPVPHQRYWE